MKLLQIEAQEQSNGPLLSVLVGVQFRFQGRAAQRALPGPLAAVGEQPAMGAWDVG